MSWVLGVFGEAGSLPSTSHIDGMCDAQRVRGGDVRDTWRDDSSVLAVGRFAWETESWLAGPCVVTRRGGAYVVTDGSVYGPADPSADSGGRRSNRGSGNGGAPGSGDVGARVLAAFSQWGASCAEHLEGDLSFLVWDPESRLAVCARDYGGKRPLFYGSFDGQLVVASTVAGVLASPRCGQEIDAVSVAADAAGFFAATPERTAYRDVYRLCAGHTLVWRDGEVTVRRHWHPPSAPHAGAELSDPAEELRSLLREAVSERMAPGTTSVWLSGGWDSTAVFGAGQAERQARSSEGGLHAVSLSYPPGDPGREDEWIQQVVSRWDAPIRWIDMQHVSLLDQPAQRAARRGEPFAHAFAMVNRALASASRDIGSRVAMDGVGGDQLFQVSPVYLADLLSRGRWVDLAREWKTGGLAGSGFRTFFRWAVQPLLPSPALRLATMLRRGRPLRGHLERPAPGWLEPRFVAQHDLTEREAAGTPLPRTGSRTLAEMHWYLTHPYFPRSFAAVAELALEAGVELRSPLYDDSLIRFAASRPASERSQGGEIKRLLRKAGEPWLPASVLASRSTKTGRADGYLSRSLRVTWAPFIEETLNAPLRLADLGIVNPTALRTHWARYRDHGGGDLGVSLFLTFEAELWLRGR